MNILEYYEKTVVEAAEILAKNPELSWETCLVIASSFIGAYKKAPSVVSDLTTEQKHKIEKWALSRDFPAMKAKDIFVYAGCGEECSHSEAIHTARFLHTIDVQRVAGKGFVRFHRKK